jgi:hypothetical protein
MRVVIDPCAIAEQRAAGALAAWVHREHSHGLVAPSPLRYEH